MRPIITVGLGLGDEGKGTVVDYLASVNDTEWVVRYNGGAQAAHNVVREDGVHHRYQQFGSATHHGAKTFLGGEVIVHPLRLLDEALDLQGKGIQSPLSMLVISEDSLVITPYHQELNHLRENARGKDRHGSVGLGIGETRSYAIRYPEMALRARDLKHPKVLEVMLRGIAQDLVLEARKFDHSAEINDEEFDRTVDAYAAAGQLINVAPEVDVMAEVCRGDKFVIFEGAQGVLLDQNLGFHPHTTWSDTTTRPALAMLKASGFTEYAPTIGVMRAYNTRHGAGPMPTEDPSLLPLLPEPYNSVPNELTGSFRVGYLDLMLTNYALKALPGGVDSLAVTHCDSISGQLDQICTSYMAGGKHTTRVNFRPSLEYTEDLPRQEALTDLLNCSTPVYEQVGIDSYLEVVSDFLRVPISVASFGPHASDKLALLNRDTPVTRMVRP